MRAAAAAAAASAIFYAVVKFRRESEIDCNNNYDDSLNTVVSIFLRTRPITLSPPPSSISSTVVTTSIAFTR